LFGVAMTQTTHRKGAPDGEGISPTDAILKSTTVVICPHCKALIDHIYAEPPVPKEVTLNGDQLEYKTIDPDAFDPNEYLCPRCKEVICKDEDEVIAFLKGSKVQPLAKIFKPFKHQKAIDEIQGDISEQLHYLLNAGMSHEEIVMFLEGEKLHWIALSTYDTLVAIDRIKEQ
jgi:hypothetical protein